jgi:hypothetical protein
VWQLHSGCSMRAHASHHLDVCVLCAVSGRGLRPKLRLDCVTGELACDTCGVEGTVVRVNMLGVFLVVCRVSYYMCPCCTKLRIWTGNGGDLLHWMSTIGAERRAEVIDLDRPN